MKSSEVTILTNVGIERVPFENLKIGDFFLSHDDDLYVKTGKKDALDLEGKAVREFDVDALFLVVDVVIIIKKKGDEQWKAVELR